MAGAVAGSLALIGAAAVVGAAVCRLGGLGEVRGAAPAVGLAALMVIAAAVVRLPGGTASGVVAGFIVVGAALAARPVRAAAREALPDQAVVAAGAVLVVCLPWLAAGRFGVLGMGVNDDTAAHLVATQWLIDHRMPTSVSPTGIHWGRMRSRR